MFDSFIRFPENPKVFGFPIILMNFIHRIVIQIIFETNSQLIYTYLTRNDFLVNRFNEFNIKGYKRVINEGK